MKILIGQPKRENELNQLEYELKSNPEVDVVLFPEGYFNHEKVEKVCSMALTYKTYIISGYRDENNKDRAFIVNPLGNIVLERAKTPENKPLYTPSKVEDTRLKFGYLLCREIFMGLDDMDTENADFIFNPIGVGMFSEEQFKEWTAEAKKIAIKQKTYVIGASHADGSYRNCGFSIPLAFCYDKNGNEVLVSKNDLTTRILDLEIKKIEVI
ncbi:hypothetical protein [Rossellomorea aquimaris]|uniref:CN hydrolase domain-containing protein n=1 Tax=Rossellomorea aquimaris TaxID=189382 RepID=A0A5D4U772_9BACI|nr:hypothetical protein [Rossellomorea aquimaris]TYS83153.1 hypothetical protein FZC80_02135 [Rossellomorea aquimaris]